MAGKVLVVTTAEVANLPEFARWQGKRRGEGWEVNCLICKATDDAETVIGWSWKYTADAVYVLGPVPEPRDWYIPDGHYEAGPRLLPDWRGYAHNPTTGEFSRQVGIGPDTLEGAAEYSARVVEGRLYPRSAEVINDKGDSLDYEWRSSIDVVELVCPGAVLATQGARNVLMASERGAYVVITFGGAGASENEPPAPGSCAGVAFVDFLSSWDLDKRIGPKLLAAGVLGARFMAGYWPTRWDLLVHGATVGEAVRCSRYGEAWKPGGDYMGDPTVVLATAWAPDVPTEVKAMRGYWDTADRDHVTGWTDQPSAALVVDGKQVAANAPTVNRADVTEHYPDIPVRCGFDVPFPASVWDGKPHVVRVTTAGGDVPFDGGTSRTLTYPADTTPPPPPADTLADVVKALDADMARLKALVA